jgi:hypothetical protein
MLCRATARGTWHHRAAILSNSRIAALQTRCFRSTVATSSYNEKETPPPPPPPPAILLPSLTTKTKRLLLVALENRRNEQSNVISLPTSNRTSPRLKSSMAINAGPTMNVKLPLHQKQQQRFDAACTFLANRILLEQRRQFSESSSSSSSSTTAPAVATTTAATTATTTDDDDNSASSISSSSSSDAEKKTSGETTTRRPRKKMFLPNYGPDADQAVKILQNERKERANAKTAANVRRALSGNVVICVAKLAAWLSSGSSCMMSEFVHSVVDCGNQSLLLMGLRESRFAADRLHPYGYGKSVYFWALVSALGTFFLGAGISMSHAVGEIMEPSLQNISWHVWSVLGLSFTVDGK